MTTAVSTTILTSTLRILRDKYVDQTFRTIPLYAAMDAKGAIETEDGGSYFELPVYLGEHAGITEILTGTERINNQTTPIEESAIWDWCDYLSKVVMKGADMRSNKGKRKLISIAEGRLTNVLMMLKRAWNRQVVRGDARILTRLNTLNGAGVNGVGANPYGFFETAAFGSQTNVVGGLSKATYSSHWQNQVVDVNNNFASNGTKQMRLLSQQVRKHTEMGDIDIILASELSYMLFAASLDPKELHTSLETRNEMTGKMALKWNGADVFSEAELGFQQHGGSDKVSMMFLNSNYFKASFDKDAFFAVGEMKESENYDQWASKVTTRTQVGTPSLAVHGIVKNAEQ